MAFDIYAEITNRIVALLEQGVAPWKSPYLRKIGLPRNFATGKHYRGMNVFLLASQCFASPYFLTYLQAQELGGHVRKGERGALVVKYGTYLSENSCEHLEKRQYLKFYTVFNSAQIEGLTFPEAPLPARYDSSVQCERARAIISRMSHAPTLKEGYAMSSYDRITDTVFMPEKRYFTQETAYYSTLFHELAHSTGHQSRLARQTLLENNGYAATRKTYCQEELVAEMAACFLNADAGIIEDEIENAAAYLQGWISVLKGKDAKRWLIKAASEAQKAADYILGPD